MSVDHGPVAEVDIDVRLVRRLLEAQFPHLAELPLEPVNAVGWDNAIYRLGPDLAVRLPRRTIGAAQVEKEHRWLPMLAPRLPLEIPVPLGKGSPGQGYPWHWTVCRWHEGSMAAVAPVADPRQAAITLAAFVATLQAIDPVDGLDNEFRGGPLATYDPVARSAIHAAGSGPNVDAAGRGSGAEAADRGLNVDAATAAWEEALGTPEWRGPGVWLHGDLHPANLLVERGRLSAVIDFGLLAVGDPAADVMVAWTFLSAETREVFRACLAVDDATWARGRGWALTIGLMIATRSSDNPVLAHVGRRTVSEVLADHGHVAWID